MTLSQKCSQYINGHKLKWSRSWKNVDPYVYSSCESHLGGMNCSLPLPFVPCLPYVLRSHNFSLWCTHIFGWDVQLSSDSGGCVLCGCIRRLRRTF